MDKQKSKEEETKKGSPLKAFLTHLAIFVIAFLIVLFVPVFYDGKIDFNFEDRGPMLYGFIGWGVGLVIHGTVVLLNMLSNQSTT